MRAKSCLHAVTRLTFQAFGMTYGSADDKGEAIAMETSWQSNRVSEMVKSLLLGLVAWSWTVLTVEAQPRPGDIFREYRYTAETIFELDPGSKRTDAKLLKRRSISHRERNLDIYDLEDAVRAELALELWGGHVGTSGQKFRLNGSTWVDIPQIQGTTADPRCYFRTLLGGVNIPVPLSQIKLGRNVFEFLAGPQICHGFDWGIYRVYAFTVRIYYNSSKPRPNGQIIQPAHGAVIGDLPVLAVEASGTKGDANKLEFTKSSVSKVEYLGEFEDVNWEGDGIYRQWHFLLEKGELTRHIGTTTVAPYRVSWDNHWVPDQSQPIQLAARITDTHGITYMTPAVEVRLARTARSVKMYKPLEIPEAFGVRAGKTMSCKIEVPEVPGTATAGRLFLSTWAGEHADAIRLNQIQLAERAGRPDEYSFDWIIVDPKAVRQGTNIFTIFSASKEHAAEINWPGPILLLEFPVAVKR